MKLVGCWGWGTGPVAAPTAHPLPGSPPGHSVTLSALGLAFPAVAIPRPPSPSLRPVPATRVRPSPWQRRCQATRSRDSGPSPGRGRGAERRGGGAKRRGGVALGKGAWLCVAKGRLLGARGENGGRQGVVGSRPWPWMSPSLSLCPACSVPSTPAQPLCSPRALPSPQ